MNKDNIKTCLENSNIIKLLSPYMEPETFLFIIEANNADENGFPKIIVKKKFSLRKDAKGKSKLELYLCDVIINFFYTYAGVYCCYCRKTECGKVHTF